jgi:predicted component of type VI protein secretion system
VAKLVFRSGPYAGKSVSLPVGKAIVVGRNRDIDLPLPDLKLSRRHCQIMVQEGGDVLVKDLNSTNGTFLNGGRIIEEMPVNAFDRIVIGDTEMELQATERNDDFEAPMMSSDSASPTRQNANDVVGSTVEHAQPTPLELAVQEMMLPLPPEPPAMQVAAEAAIIEPPRLIFCDMCNESIPISDWQLGNAKEFNGKNYCKACMAKGVVVGAPVPKTASSAQSMDDMLAGLNEEAVVVDTTIKRRGVAVTDEKVAESITNFERATNQPGRAPSERRPAVQAAAPAVKPAPKPAPVPPPAPAPAPSANTSELGDEFEEIG